MRTVYRKIKCTQCLLHYKIVVDLPEEQYQLCEISLF